MAKAATFSFNFFRALEVFAAVVETRQVTQAAEILGMTQSAASQHLKNLETALGTTLLERATRPIQLTKAGVSLHRRAVRILNEAEDLRAEIRRLEAAPLPLLRVAMLASIATTLTPAVTHFARGRFGIPEVSLFAGLASDHQSLLRNRRADVAITSDDHFEIEGLVRHPVLREDFLLVTPKDYAGPLDDLAELAKNLPLVRFSRETAVGRRSDQHLSRLRLEIPRAMEGDRASIVMAPIAAGIGFALLTPSLLIDGLNEGMQVDVHPLPIPGFSREIMLVARERELGDLPALLAAETAEVLASSIAECLPDLTQRACQVPPAIA